MFFSPFALKGILLQKYYKNWMKFVNIMHILGKTVPLHKLSLVQQEIVSFLKEYQSLYGKN